jgi:hypothetical protein
MGLIARLIWTAGFLVGTATHVMDLVAGGWLPYTTAPLWMNLYWTSLTGLDPLVAFLLWTRPRQGVWLGVVVMATDIAVNAYAAYGLGFAGFELPLQLQCLFGGFVFGSAALLLKRV